MPPTKKKKPNLMRRAKRDVRLASQPYFSELKRAEREGERNFADTEARTSQYYGALQSQLGQFAPQYDQLAQGIVGSTNQAIGSMIPQVGTNSGAENAAATNALAAMGGAGTNLLNSQRMANVNYFQGTQNRAGIEQMQVQRDNLDILNELKNEIAQQRLEGKKMMPAQILSRVDELRSEKKDRRLAQQELEIRQSLADRELDLAEKQHRTSSRQSNRAQNAATKILTEEQQRRNLSKDIRQLQNQIARITGDIRETKMEESPGWEGASGQASKTAEELAGLRRKRLRKTKKLKAKRKRKRNL